MNLYGNPSVLNMPHCTHDIPPHSSWYPPSVLMVSSGCTEHPVVLMIFPWCTKTPRCTQFYLHGVLNIPRRTAHLRYAAQTLCRVLLCFSRVEYSTPKQTIAWTVRFIVLYKLIVNDFIKQPQVFSGETCSEVQNHNVSFNKHDITAVQTIQRSIRRHAKS